MFLHVARSYDKTISFPCNVKFHGSSYHVAHVIDQMIIDFICSTNHDTWAYTRALMLTYFWPSYICISFNELIASNSYACCASHGIIGTLLPYVIPRYSNEIYEEESLISQIRPLAMSQDVIMNGVVCPCYTTQHLRLLDHHISRA